MDVTELTFKIPNDQISEFVWIIWDGIAADKENISIDLIEYLDEQCDKILDQEDRRQGGIGYLHHGR